MSENIATMNSVELADHIDSLEQAHRRRKRHLNALLRARRDEEQAARDAAKAEGDGEK